MGVSSVSFSAFGDTQKNIRVVDVKSVQEEIAKTHAAWRAKESWVTNLSQDDIHRMLGLQRAPTGRLDFEAMRPSMFEANSSLDWRNINGVNWLGDVMNQGNCGSCVAFAVVATLEARYSISSGMPWLHPTFSPQALFGCGGGGCETGWLPELAANYLHDTGIPDEACMPYTSGSTGQDVSCSQKCADADARTFRITNSTMPTSYGGSVEDVKAALKRGPLVTTLMVYTDFLTYAGGVYKHVTGSAAGGHAVSLIGYDDSKRAWLIRNSWGHEWGENGFGWISWDDTSGIGSDTWDYELPASQAYVSVTTPVEHEYISGQYQLTAQSNEAGRQAIKFHIKGASKEIIVSNICLSGTQTCSNQLDTTTIPEGRYEIFAESDSGVKSQVRQFYVINSEPKLSLSFGPAPGVDLSAPLSGRLEFLVTSGGGSVPMQTLEFRVLNESGKIVSSKSTSYVLEKMKLGWRTITVPNGQYKILFHGETKYKGTVYSVDTPAVSVTVKQ